MDVKSVTQVAMRSHESVPPQPEASKTRSHAFANEAQTYLDSEQLHLAAVVDALSEGSHQDLPSCVGVGQQPSPSRQIQPDLHLTPRTVVQRPT